MDIAFHLKSLCCSIRIWATFPWTGRQFTSGVLHRIQFRTCCFVPMSNCHVFTQRPMTGQKIEQSNSCSFGLQQLLANSTRKKRDSSLPNIYIAWRPFWLLNWVSIASRRRKSGSTFLDCFPQASLLRPAVTAADLETPCVCARPSDPLRLCRNAAPRKFLARFPFPVSSSFQQVSPVTDVPWLLSLEWRIAPSHHTKKLLVRWAWRSARKQCLNHP